MRHPTGSCVDESGCDFEAYTACAFDAAPDMDTSVAFLVCMDETTQRTAAKAAEPCASTTGLDFSTIDTCATGAKGKQLLQAASADFNKKLPGSTTIPHTFVNDDDVDPQYSGLKKALCSAGSTSSACGSLKAGKCVA